MMKKTNLTRLYPVVALLLALAALCAFAGCGESAAQKPAVVMQYQEYGASIIEVPMFTGEAEAIDPINAEIAEDLAYYIDGWKAVTDEETTWYEVKSYPITTDKYAQVAVTAIEYPNYATDGDLFSYCVDKENGRRLTISDALESAGMTSVELNTALGELIVPYLYEGDNVTYISCNDFIYSGDELVLLVKVSLANAEASDQDRIFIYYVDRNELLSYDGFLLLPADICDTTDPALNYNRLQG